MTHVEVWLQSDDADSASDHSNSKESGSSDDFHASGSADHETSHPVWSPSHPTTAMRDVPSVPFSTETSPHLTSAASDAVGMSKGLASV